MLKLSGFKWITQSTSDPPVGLTATIVTAVWCTCPGPAEPRAHLAGRWEIPSRWTDTSSACGSESPDCLLPVKGGANCGTTSHFRISTNKRRLFFFLDKWDTWVISVNICDSAAAAFSRTRAQSWARVVSVTWCQAWQDTVPAGRCRLALLKEKNSLRSWQRCRHVEIKAAFWPAKRCGVWPLPERGLGVQGGRWGVQGSTVSSAPFTVSSCTIVNIVMIVLIWRMGS